MFARAGVTGRILRSGRDGTAPVSLHPFLARPKKKEKTKCYCYVPFVWQALVAVISGIFALMAGTAMCTFGYYAIPLPLTSNGTTNSTPEDSSSEKAVPDLSSEEYGHLHNLAYVGPVLMGVGCFVIVISCVHVCEIRDQKIKEFEERRKAAEAKRGGKKARKQRVYDLIVKQLRERLLKEKEQQQKQMQQQKDDIESGQSAQDSTDKGIPAKAQHHREILKGLLRRCSAFSVASNRSDYSNISAALKTIPMDIFTVDMDGKKDTSLHPIKVHKAPKRCCNHTLTKYPSDPCLSQSCSHRPSRSLMQFDRSAHGAHRQQRDDRVKTEGIPDDPQSSERSSIPPTQAGLREGLTHVIVHQAAVHDDGDRLSPRSAWSHELIAMDTESCSLPNGVVQTSLVESPRSAAHSAQLRRATIPNGDEGVRLTKGPLISMPSVERAEPLRDRAKSSEAKFFQYAKSHHHKQDDQFHA